MGALDVYIYIRSSIPPASSSSSSQPAEAIQGGTSLNKLLPTVSSSQRTISFIPKRSYGHRVQRCTQTSKRRSSRFGSKRRTSRPCRNKHRSSVLLEEIAMLCDASRCEKRRHRVAVVFPLRSFMFEWVYFLALSRSSVLGR